MKKSDKTEQLSQAILGSQMEGEEEKLQIDEVGDGEIDEGAISSQLQLTAEDRTLSKKLIQSMIVAIDDAESESDLIETCRRAFSFVVFLANSIQSTSIIKSLKNLGPVILQKIKDLTSSHGDSSQQKQDVFKDILSGFQDAISQVQHASDDSALILTPSASLGLLLLTNQILFPKCQSLKVPFTPDLARSLISLAISLADFQQAKFNIMTEELYQNLKKLEGFNSDAFVAEVLTKFTHPIRHTFLTYIASDNKDAKLFSEIGAKFNELVMNDKEKSNSHNIKYFIPFLRAIDEKTFTSVVYPEIDFMMKRSGQLILLIKEVVNYVSFPFTPELVQSFTSQLFIDEYLFKEEYINDSKTFFATLASKVETSKDLVNNVVFDFLYKRFQQTRNSSVTPVQRLTFIRHMTSALSVIKNKDFIDLDLLKQAITTVVEYMFQHKDESLLRDSFDDILSLLRVADNLAFLVEGFKKLITKASNIWHINLLTVLMDKNYPGLNDLIAVAAPQFKTMLSGENFQSTVNFSQILALIGFFCSATLYTKDQQGYLSWIVHNQSVLQYLCHPRAFLNSLAYLQKNPSLHDVSSHLKAIKLLIKYHYTDQPLSGPSGDSQLRDTLCEYILNDQYKTREHLILEALEYICANAGESFSSHFVKTLHNKIKQVSSRSPAYNREEAPHKPSQTLSNKVRFTLKVIIKKKKSDLNSEEFIYLVKVICHPFVSQTNKDLKTQIQSLESLFQNGRLSQYFEQNASILTDFAIRQRSGILSPDPILRAQAINIGVALASQNLISHFLGDIAQVLNYKPLEMTQKLEKIFVAEFDRISFYDLMLYSEVSKDLLNIFKDKDQAIVKKELGAHADQSTSDSQEGSPSSLAEEEKEEAPAKNIDPSKLAAMMLKQAAAQKKSSAAAKKPAQSSKAAPAKPQAAKPKPAAHKEEAPVAHQPLDKEKRNKQDRDQIIFYMQEIQRIKGQQVQAALEIVKRANINNLYLDLTLNQLLIPMIKLLNYSATRFTTNICMQSLFESHRKEPLFEVRQEIVSCLNAMSCQRIFIKHQNQFTSIFKHIQNKTNVGLFDKGYIQLIIMMANYVLKDLSVNLGVKEQALAVLQSILEDSNLVENIDLVIVTINMMKSSYNNENLGQYINLLLKRLNLEQLALILQRTFEYEPVPRMILLKELIEYETPLCCPVWFSTQIWILQFDEECGKLARKLWNKYGLVLRSGTIDLAQETSTYNMFYYLRSKNTNIFDNSIRGIVSAIEIFSNRYDLVVDDLIEFYNKEMQIIEQEGLQQQIASQNAESIEAGAAASKSVVSDDRLNRIAVADIVKRTAHLVSSNSFKKIFDFFITKGCLDQNEQVSKACMEAALQIIQTKGPDYSEEILKILEKYINEQKKYSELSKNQAIIMIGALANYLDNTSQKKLVGTFEKMLELLNTPSELIRQSICRVIPQLARFFEDKSKKFLEDHLRILKDATDDKILRGSAYAVSGIIKGLGMQNFIEMDLLTTIQKDCFSKHSDPFRKVAGLYLYETLTISLGKMFEMNVQKILPNIIQTISDPKEQVRRAAIQANRTIMSKLSNHAIKQVLPIFLKGLENDNWRSKLASVEALGNMAFCAPRQISSFLPNIVKGIREVLSDTHEKVHEAALQAIQNIGSVIKCPEIADILETLVKALSNPNQHLKGAMKVLLDTSFVHAIDAPSLSLLIPILDSGLMMHDNESKHLASKLMGNICNLTQDPEDLLPYIKILMPAIKNSLFDSIPEIRASAAKALGSLSKGLGLDNFQDMIEWLHQVLRSKVLHASERSGAAQGFAEIISVHGTKFFEDTIKLVILQSQDPQPHIREAYRSVMVFLATSFDQFVKYLPKLLPIMIQGLSDDVEEVRKISLRNVKICIKFFGKQAPIQLTQPIMEMMFHKDFRVRQSSSTLMYQLVKELENDVIKLQPKYISVETKNDILASMFILKYDIIERVAQQASQIWKNIIDNQQKVVKTIIDVLIKQVFDLILNDQMELQEMGLNCMRGIVEKFGEKFVSETLDILEVYMERATSQKQSIAVTKAIYNMTYASPIKLLTDLRVKFLQLVDGNISSENEEIRSLTAKIIVITLQKTFEPNFMTQTLDKQFLKKLHHFISLDQSREAELLVQTLKELLKEQAPELKLEDKIIHLCNMIDQGKETKLLIAQARVLASVAVKIGANMFKKKNCASILNKLTKELTIDDIDDEKRIGEVLVTFSEVISQAPEGDIVTLNEQVICEFYTQCMKKDRMGFYVDFIAYYCQNTKVNYEKFAKMYLENVLVFMNNASEKLVEKVVKSFAAIINGLQKENQFTLIPLIKQCIENIGVLPVTVGERSLYKKKVQTIKMLEKADGVKTLSAVIQNSITHGSIEIRIDSAICFQYLIDFSKPDAIKTEIIKICGALIRVVNDKFPPALKLQIFQALKLILLRASMQAKVMAPQLQTTFLKAFNDTQASPLVRKLVVDCIIHFLKIAPKVDPILKELSVMLEGDKLEDIAKIEVGEILAIIIRMNGKSVQQTMSSQIQTTLMNILNAKQGTYNDKTIVNSAVALAFLSAYSSDQAQMQQLFEAFDNRLLLNISFGLKFGILLNGNSSALAPTLLPQLESHLKDTLKDLTGVEEVDGHYTDDQKDDQGDGRLHGSFEILGHIGDVFVRRFCSANDELYKIQFRALNNSGLFAKLNSQSSVCNQTYKQVLFYLQSISMKMTGVDTFDPELSQIIRDGFAFINSFYLEQQSGKKEANQAVLNLLMLNYDHFLGADDDSKIQELNTQLAKTVVNKECYSMVLPDLIRMLAVEFAFL